MGTDGTLIGNEKGIAAVYIALILVMVVALAGIVIDFSYMYIAKGQLQNASDAAALAGSSRLPKRPAVTNLTAFGNLSAARKEAWRFAYKNKIVPSGKSVFLVASSSYNSPPSNLNNSNDPTGDIVVGHWDSGSGFTPASAGTTKSINAVKTVARKTSDPPVDGVKEGDNPIPTFLGKVIGWNNMSVNADAVAALPPGATNYILMCSTFDPSSGTNTGGLECTPGCSYPNICTISPRTISRNPTTPYNEAFAWTSLSKTNTTNNWLTEQICAQNFPDEDVCGEPMYTTEGATNSTSALETAMYNPHLDTSNKECGTDASGNPIICNGSNGPVTAWWIIIPVSTNTASPSTPGCPPQRQPSPFYVDHFALIRLTKACHSGGGIPPGCQSYQAPSCPGGGDTITFDKYSCMTCAQRDIYTGLKWKLVK
jgi:Flp pilus assembly protein TadG